MPKRKGKNQANRGRSWETRLDRVHKFYDKAGLAYIARLHPPYLMRKSLGRGAFEGILLGQGPPDYLICTSGYTFLVDAKEHKTNRLPFAKVPQHQASAFDLLSERGGNKMTGLLLVNFAKVHTAVALDWKDVKEAYYFWCRERIKGNRSKSGVASLSFEEAHEKSLWIGDSLLGSCDYLPSVLLALRLREDQEE